MRPVHQRYISRPFPDRQSSNASVAMARPLNVRRYITVDTDCFGPILRELIKSCRAHSAKPDDYDVKSLFSHVTALIS